MDESVRDWIGEGENRGGKRVRWGVGEAGVLKKREYGLPIQREWVSASFRQTKGGEGGASESSPSMGKKKSVFCFFLPSYGEKVAS